VYEDLTERSPMIPNGQAHRAMASSAAKSSSSTPPRGRAPRRRPDSFDAVKAVVLGHGARAARRRGTYEAPVEVLPVAAAVHHDDDDDDDDSRRGEKEEEQRPSPKTLRATRRSGRSFPHTTTYPRPSPRGRARPPSARARAATPRRAANPRRATSKSPY
jgi:hypothetical protein